MIQPPQITKFAKPNELATGMSKTQFFAKYLIDSKIIGQGSFAVVRRRVTDETILAMKIIKKKNIDKEADMELIRRDNHFSEFGPPQCDPRLWLVRD